MRHKIASAEGFREHLCAVPPVDGSIHQNHPRIGRWPRPGRGAANQAIDVDSEAEAIRLVEFVKVLTSAPSLAGIEALVEHRLKSDLDTDSDVVRLSVGLEDPADLIADLAHAI